MKKYNIHPDFMKFKSISMPLNPVLLPAINSFLTKVYYMTPVPKLLTETQKEIAGYNGEKIKLDILAPSEKNENMPVLVYFHGGAFAAQAAPYLKHMLCEYAIKTPCCIVFADYHLLPKAKFPTGAEDCFSAYKWVLENAESLGADKSRIAVGGDSAGGMLAIDVCMLAQERNLPVPCFQLLVYPEADAKQTTQSIRKFTDTPLWNGRLNAKQWKMYLKRGEDLNNRLLTPCFAESLKGMPSAFVEVSEFDCLRDEGIAYARALQRDGVSVALVQTKRTIHGYEIAEKNGIVRESISRRIAVLRDAFYYVKQQQPK